MESSGLTSFALNSLVRYWELQHSGEFLDYLRTTFRLDLDDHPRFAALTILEAEGGNAKIASLGGRFKRSWVVDDRGCREHVGDFEFDCSGSFYVKPVLKFLVQGRHVAIGETWGPSLMCRKAGVADAEGEVSLALRFVSSRDPAGP